MMRVVLAVAAVVLIGCTGETVGQPGDDEGPAHREAPVDASRGDVAPGGEPRDADARSDPGQSRDQKPRPSLDWRYFLMQTERGESTAFAARGSEESVEFDIQSATGIGDLVLSRLGEAWSQRVTLRLHLQGLESVELSTDSHTLTTSVSSSDGAVRPTQVMEGPSADEGSNPEQVAADHEFRLPVRLVPVEGGEVGIPLDGHFEVTVPAALLRENPKSITLRWIDFYR